MFRFQAHLFQSMGLITTLPSQKMLFFSFMWFSRHQLRTKTGHVNSIFFFLVNAGHEHRPGLPGRGESTDEGFIVSLVIERVITVAGNSAHLEYTWELE